MGLSHEHVGPKILAKIKIYILTRAELLCPLCYEIPCTYLYLLLYIVHMYAVSWGFESSGADM